VWGGVVGGWPQKDWRWPIFDDKRVNSSISVVGM
jgi:hypothetical protein